MLWKFKAQDTFWGVTSSDMVSRLPPLSAAVLRLRLGAYNSM